MINTESIPNTFDGNKVISEGNILAIDTTSRYGSVSLYKSGNPNLFVSFIDDANGHDELLTACILKTLKAADIGISDIDKVLVSNGPGAFTGLRIGLSYAKGLCAALGIDLITCDTLQAAASSKKSDSDIAIVRHSHAEVYYVGHSYGSSQLVEGSEHIDSIIDQVSESQAIRFTRIEEVPKPELDDSSISALDILKAYLQNPSSDMFQTSEAGIEAKPYYRQLFEPSKSTKKL
ncbi:MAG: hypothetical protein Kapaf2KO_19320 [Candidatus Kapaibacteriales bacterium]